MRSLLRYEPDCGPDEISLALALHQPVQRLLHDRRGGRSGLSRQQRGRLDVQSRGYIDERMKKQFLPALFDIAYRRALQAHRRGQGFL